MVTSVNIVDACRLFTLERLTLLTYCLKVVRNMLLICTCGTNCSSGFVVNANVLFQDLIVSNDLLF